MMLYPPIPGVTVIGFGGPARAGKDTAASIMFALNPLDSMRFAFSDAITHYCRIVHGMEKRHPGLLQTTGQELRRTVRARVWLDCVYWRVDELRPRVALITGVRFPEEIQMVRDMGGRLFWVERRDADGTAPAVTDRDPNFVTETSVHAGMFDQRLVNVTGKLADFAAVVTDAYSMV